MNQECFKLNFHSVPMHRNYQAEKKLTFSGNTTNQNFFFKIIFRLTKRQRFYAILLLSLSIQTLGFTQNFWEDKDIIDSLKSGIHATYNFNFEKAEVIRNHIQTKYPLHPASLLYEAIVMYWENYPLLADSEKGKQLETLLLQSIAGAETELQKMPDHQLTRFFAMMPRLMLIEYYADNGLAIRSIPHITSIYKSIVSGFEMRITTPEFYFTTGLYNYYREAYPKSNPFYKPFVCFFPDGNKTEGLNELYKCWKLSDFVGPEAMSFLSYIYINFETDYTKGIKYTRELTIEYPNNPLFAEHYIQLLLLNKQYITANEVLTQIRNNNRLSPYFRITASIYEAIICEHKHTDLAPVEKTYHSAINSIKNYGSFSRRYLAYAYFGLSRIYAQKGLNEQSKQYKLLAEKTAQYPHVNFN